RRRRPRHSGPKGACCERPGWPLRVEARSRGRQAAGRMARGKGPRGARAEVQDGPERAIGMPLLEVDDLRVGYGAIPVLQGISFAVEEGKTTVLLGLNGAGK